MRWVPCSSCVKVGRAKKVVGHVGTVHAEVELAALVQARLYPDQAALDVFATQVSAPGAIDSKRCRRLREALVDTCTAQGFGCLGTSRSWRWCSPASFAPRPRPRTVGWSGWVTLDRVGVCESSMPVPVNSTMHGFIRSCCDHHVKVDMALRLVA